MPRAASSASVTTWSAANTAASSSARRRAASQSGPSRGSGLSAMASILFFCVVLLGELERLVAHSADHRAVFDLLGGHVQLAGRLARALDCHAAAAALLRLLALAVLAALSPALAVLAAAGDDGAAWQEGQPGGVYRADDVGVVGGGLVGDLAVRPADHLLRPVRPEQAELDPQRHEPLVVVPVAFTAGFLDASRDGERVRGLVQHYLNHRATPGGEQLAGHEQLGHPRLGRVGDPPLGPVVALQA